MCCVQGGGCPWSKGSIPYDFLTFNFLYIKEFKNRKAYSDGLWKLPDSLNPGRFFYIIQAMSTVNYPTKTVVQGTGRMSDNHADRGVSLEEDINDSNLYYRERNRALIYKKPTPVQVVRVDYPRRGKAKIVEAYYRTPSTTDYNGLYKGRYIDFEAKQTQNRTRFPKYLVQEHQIRHLEKVHEQGGIGFFIVRFTSLHETYLVDAMELIAAHAEGEAKSIPYAWFRTHGTLLKEGYCPRIDYLRAVDEKYLSQDSSK